LKEITNDQASFLQEIAWETKVLNE